MPKFYKCHTARSSALKLEITCMMNILLEDKDLEAAVLSYLEALVLRGDFKHPDMCWRDSTTGHKQSRRFLNPIGDDFLHQVIEEPMRRNDLLDLILTKKQGLIGDMKIKSSLGCSGHEMVEFRILRAGRRVKFKLTTLDYRIAGFGLFKDLLGRVKWDQVLEGRRAQEN
ncbi:glycerol kinase [Limosa lapponica baueri]|uniref:Glycerol kinase n=1 Tax=Limosa lapponica baueri TaxID=1758121 RepID=A0A2I0UDV6_LIMLA|nr:glycerol kinase [Limosa lapponica baueri]